MGTLSIGVILALLVVWLFALRRRLGAMAENVDNAMNQIGIQLSSRLEALTALLQLTEGYAGEEAQIWMEALQSHREEITSASLPRDVRRQEDMIVETLEHILSAAEQYPALKSDKDYLQRMGAVKGYEKMMRTSSLIYNDSVEKLNGELRRFPASLVGSLFGFRRRDCLEVAERKSAIPEFR